MGVLLSAQSNQTDKLMVVLMAARNHPLNEGTEGIKFPWRKLIYKRRELLTPKNIDTWGQATLLDRGDTQQELSNRKENIKENEDNRMNIPSLQGSKITPQL